MRIAIIIPAHHRPVTLWALLVRLRAEGALDHVCVAIDGRDHAVERVVTVFGIRSILHEGAMGAAAARNAGARHCPADWYVFLDDDVVPSSGWWQNVQQVLAYTRADLLSGAVLYEGARHYPERVVENPRAAFPLGAHLLVRGSVFHALGGFDPACSALHNEDLEFTLRVLGEGFRWEHRPDLRVYHEAQWWSSPQTVLRAASFTGEVPRLRKIYGPQFSSLPIAHLGPLYFPREMLVLLFFPVLVFPLLLRFCFLHRQHLARALPYFFAKWPASLLLRRWYLWKSAWKHRVFCV